MNAEAMAITLIALVDGLWLELCLDPTGMTPESAKAACLALLEPVLGPMGGHA